ncbi:MAG TPA: hypothetical protein DCG72_13455 [Gammaproteobacteria bacterium]|nr:hypothetical protein [Gammaproteobacteria bacterium]
MAITTHSAPPSQVTAGDVYQWTDTPTDIDDVSAYSVLFRSVDDSNVSFSVSGTDDTTVFSFSLAGSDTEFLDGGDFVITKIITYSWGRETESAGVLTLLNNPLADPTKSFNQRMVDLLQAHLEGRIPQGLESHTVGGLPINKIPIPEASRLLYEYERRLAAEVAADRSKRGLASGNTVKLHFFGS